MSENLHYNIHKISKEVKYSVVITDFVLTIYVLWLIITDTSHWIPGVLLGYTPIGFILLLRANKIFGLCCIHRSMLTHSFIVYVCCVYQAYFGFGCILYPMRILMFSIGLYLIIMLFKIKRDCEKQSLKKTNNKTIIP